MKGFLFKMLCLLSILSLVLTSWLNGRSLAKNVFMSECIYIYILTRLSFEMLCQLSILLVDTVTENFSSSICYIVYIMIG